VERVKVNHILNKNIFILFQLYTNGNIDNRIKVSTTEETNNNNNKKKSI